MGATARTIDLTNVKEGGNFNKKRIPSGDYLAKIIKVEDAVAKEDKTPQYLFTVQIVSHSATKLPYYCKLQANQLWKLRNIFIAAGKTVPKKKMRIDPNLIVGKLIGVTIEDTEYKEEEQSEIAGVFPSAELGDASAVSGSDDNEPDEPDDDEDEPTEEDVDDVESTADEETEEEVEEEAEPDADPYADLDRDELKRRIKAQQPDFKVFKTTTDDALREALRLLEVTSDQEEDESEEPEPAPRAKRKPKTPTADLSDDDLDDLDIDSI